ncbi:MAG: hypothetical protein IPL78_27315 [Chloroflexi bacterium]|nr:hypothetical protein [Chloroflexota bacterium]
MLVRRLTAHYSLHSALSTQHSALKHYPTLGAAALKAGDVPCYRVWLACRYLDGAGRGWLGLEQVEQALAEGKGVLSLGGLKRLRQLLAQGEGRYWLRDGQGRLWLYGAGRVAAALGLRNQRPTGLTASGSSHWGHQNLQGPPVRGVAQRPQN